MTEDVLPAARISDNQERMRTASLFVAGIFMIGGCDDENLTRVAGELELERTIDFGDVQIGIEKTIQLELKNSGGARVIVESIDTDPTFTAEQYDFRVKHDGFTVQPSEVLQLEIGFRPFE